MSLRRIWLTAALAVIVGAAAGLPALATSLDGVMNLSTLVHNSPLIVVGTVADVTTGTMDSNVPYVEIQVNVSRTLRGSAGGMLTFRQLNLPAPRPAENGRRYIGVVPGMPRYTKGEQVLLFLAADGGQGLRTTVGLEMGKFVLVGGTAQNGVQNQGLFRNVSLPAGLLLDQKEESMFATTKGGVATDTFVNLIQRAVDGGWWETSGRRPRPRLTTDTRTVSPKPGTTEFGIGGSSNE